MKEIYQKNKLFHCLLIIILGLLIYSNTFEAPFYLDDSADIIRNPLIKDFTYFINLDETREKILREIGSLGAPSFFTRYVAQLTFALNYHIHELDVTGYHVVNLAIHLINALLVYFIILFTFRTPAMKDSALEERAGLISLVSALLFVAHPLQTQAVTYIVQRYASLATMFYLLSLFTYICSRLAHLKWKSILLYMLCIVSAAAGMITKEIVFTLPFVIIMYDLFFFKGDFKSRIPRLSLILLTAFIIPLSIFWHDTSQAGVATAVDEASRYGTGITRVEYLCTQFRVLVTYIRLIFLPVNQNLDYDYPIYDSFLSLPVLISFLFLLLIFSLSIYLLYKSKKNSGLKLVSFGILWFFITISIESSIIPLPDIIFEHRVYLPGFGAFLAIATGLYMIANMVRYKHIGTLVMSITAIIILTFSVTAYMRNQLWTDKVIFWEDVVSKSPKKARAHNNLGLSYNTRGLTAKAKTHFLISINLDPDYAEPHFNLGMHYLAKGDANKARREFSETIRINPRIVQAGKFLNFLSRQGVVNHK